MMATLLMIGMLAIFTIVASYLSVFVLNIFGLPGALIAGAPGARSKGRFIFGSLISALGQSFIYLAFVLGITSWTRQIIASDKASSVLWIAAFLAVAIPIWKTLIHARVEQQGSVHANPQVEALNITTVISLIAFFVFAFFPSAGSTIYNWVPYVN